MSAKSNGVTLVVLHPPLPPVEPLGVGQMHPGAVRLQQIHHPIPAVSGLDHHLGVRARLRHRRRDRQRVVCHPRRRQPLAAGAHAHDHRATTVKVDPDVLSTHRGLLLYVRGWLREARVRNESDPHGEQRPRSFIASDLAPMVLRLGPSALRSVRAPHRDDASSARPRDSRRYTRDTTTREGRCRPRHPCCGRRRRTRTQDPLRHVAPSRQGTKRQNGVMSPACVGRPIQPPKDVSSDLTNRPIVVNRVLREAHAASVLHPRDRLGKVI
jgi:hypothetical protein